MELNAMEFFNIAPLHNNYSFCTKHPTLCCNCPIKIFLLEDVSYYRPSGSLWSSLQPIIWTFTSGSHCDQRSSQADLETACPPQIHTYCMRGKTENWPLVIVSRQLHSAPLWSQVTERLTFTMEIMTCSCARSSEGYHRERDTSGDMWQYLEERVCTQHFDSPRN